MSHIVKCKYCGKTFDADLEPYVKPSVRRYAHADCAKRYYDEHSEIFDLDVYDIKKGNTNCNICGKMIEPDEEKIETAKGIFCHSACLKDKQTNASEDEVQKTEKKIAINTKTISEKKELNIELSEEDKLYECVMEIFDMTFIPPKVQLQIRKYMQEYKFSFSGIRRAILYWINIKHGTFDKSVPSLGIIPHIYTEAYNHYYTLWLAQQNNANLNVREYIPKVNRVVIDKPVRKEKRMNLFSFLDEEELDGI